MTISNESLVAQFLSAWKFERSQTLKFIEEFPVEKWNLSPRPDFGSFAKQVRHVLSVQGVQLDAFEIKKLDYSRKRSHYDGPLEKEALIAALVEKDKLFCAAVEHSSGWDLESVSIECYGDKLNYVEFMNWFFAHEGQHRGMWKFY